jgi:hypothetical protein
LSGKDEPHEILAAPVRFVAATSTGARLILSVDDEPAILLMREAILECEGYAVPSAADRKGSQGDCVTDPSAAAGEECAHNSLHLRLHGGGKWIRTSGTVFELHASVMEARALQSPRS